MHELAAQTDPSFIGAVRAQEKKQLKGLDHLEKRLLKAQKRKLKDQVNRMIELQNELFPGQGLQERNRNFAELYLELGDNWVPALLEGLAGWACDAEGNVVDITARAVGHERDEVIRWVGGEAVGHDPGELTEIIRGGHAHLPSVDELPGNAADVV